MAASSTSPYAASLPEPGMYPANMRNRLREKLARCKREAVEMVLGKGESWLTKIINGQSGIMLEDLPALLDSQDLKVVSKEKTCVDPDIAKAMEKIVRRFACERSVLLEDAE